MMRLVVGKLLSVVARYPPLVDGAFVIIAWVGLKLCIEYLHATGHLGFQIPQWLSLALIVAIFCGAYGFARRARESADGQGDAGGERPDRA